MRARRRNEPDYPFGVTTSPAKRLILLYGLLAALTYVDAPLSSDLGFPGLLVIVGQLLIIFTPAVRAHAF